MSLGDDIITGLHDVLARVLNLDLFPPWDAARTLVDAAATARRIASQPPLPAPDDLAVAASAWRSVARSVDLACDDVRTTATAVGPHAWSGDAGDSFRGSLTTLHRRTSTVPLAAGGVALALDRLGDVMTGARARHAAADDLLRDNLEIRLGDLMPWEAVDHLRGTVRGLSHAITESIGAYQEAAAAVARARQDIVAAMDGIELPDRLPAGVSPIAVVNAWDDESGPLAGAALDRYDDAFGALSPQEQAAVREALASARTDAERGWIVAGVASGLSGAALVRYVAALRSLPADGLKFLDPRTLMPTSGTDADGEPTGRSTYSQPDDTTCGSSSLVMARMLNDPAYALYMATGLDVETGEQHDGSPGSRFTDESNRMHDRTNGLHDRDGGFQVPWAKPLGTQPWAIAGEMSSDGGSGVAGRSYGVDQIAPSDRGRAFDHIARSVEDGDAVPLYVGSSTAPRHVVLVIGADGGDQVTIYDPASGQQQSIDRRDFVSGNLDAAGWDEPWMAITPERR